MALPEEGERGIDVVVRLTTLKLENFRGFPGFETSFHERVTVFIGENASGKSSILDAAAIAIGAFFLGFPDIRPPKIADADIRRITHTTHGIDIERVYPVAISASGVVDQQATSWRRELRQARGKTTHGDARALQTQGELAWQRIANGEDTDVPVLAYYGAGRLWAQKRDSSLKALALASRASGYVDCLEPASSHKFFAAWMKRKEQERLQDLDRAIGKGLARTQGKGLPPPTVPALEAVSDAVRACVDGAVRVFFSVAHDELRVEMTGGEVLPFSFMSDGYRNFLGMVADLAWRAVRLNPHLGRDAARRATGIVLIDEVDLHLHPRWQWSIIERLTTTFTGIQFIMTTHAPQVVASCEASWLRVLPAGRTATAPTMANASQGKDVNAVLREIMAAPERLPIVHNKLQQVRDLVEDRQTSAARLALDEVALLLGETDEQVVSLRWELADLEQHGP